MKKLEYYLFSGDEFRHLRKKMRFTQTEISKMIGVSLPMVNLIESGKRALSPEASKLFVDVVKKYLDYKINMSVDTFLKIQLRDLKNEHTEK
jgi:transcriptional regulator with XRE-family HTH domain